MEEMQTLKAAGLKSLEFGSWRLVVGPECVFVGQEPHFPLTLLYNMTDRKFIWRILGRTIEVGRVDDSAQFVRKCTDLFGQGKPCLGTKSPDQLFPMSCQFSQTCDGIVRGSGNICTSCLSQRDPVVEDMKEDVDQATIVDIIYNTRHQGSSSKDSWTCPKCQESMRLSSAKKHLKKKHFLTHFPCDSCPERFVEASKLASHTLADHHNSTQLKCPVCEFQVPITRNLRQFQEHFEPCLKQMISTKDSIVNAKRRIAMIYPCSGCPAKFGFKKLLDEHSASSCPALEQIKKEMSDLTSIEDYIDLNLDFKEEKPKVVANPATQCSICHLKVSPSFMARHLMAKHQIGGFKCPFCPEILDKVDQVRSHMSSTHSGEDQCSCPDCLDTFSVVQFLEHFQRCHTVHFIREKHKKLRKYSRICPECGRLFPSDEKLKDHVNHRCQIPCNLCDFRTKYPKNLMVHKELIHGNPRPLKGKPEKYICHLCGKEYNSRDGLYIHDRTIHQKECHTCEKCGRNFNRSTLLRSHKNRVHAESDEFLCKLCGLRFGSGHELKRHHLSHEDPKLICPTCTKKFRTKTALNQHIRIHTGEKPYKCDMCDYSTAAGGNLRNHKKFVHLGVPRAAKSSHIDKTS